MGCSGIRLPKIITFLGLPRYALFSADLAITNVSLGSPSPVTYSVGNPTRVKAQSFPLGNSHLLIFFTNTMKSPASLRATHVPTSTPASSAVVGLQPSLQNALNSLNINLDYELARYRQARQGTIPSGTVPPQFQPKRRSLSLLTVPSPKPRTQASSVSAVTPPPPPHNPRIPATATSDFTAAVDTSSVMTDSSFEVSALRSALVYQGDSSPDTYMASSASLLEPEITPSAPPRRSPPPTHAPTAHGWWAEFSTPLGLGGLLLFLVGSASLGFVLVNPTVVKHLTQNTPLARVWGQPDTETAITKTTAETTAPVAPLNPLSPDLSQREFTNLNLSTLSTLPSGVPPKFKAPTTSDRPPNTTISSSTVTPSPEPTNAPRNIPTVNAIPSTTTPPPRPVEPVYEESSPSVVELPTPAPTPTTNFEPSDTTPTENTVTSNSPSASGSQPASAYYVVTDYTGDPSLEEARTAIDDAYVRNFEVGARIQMGAFNTPEGAAAMIEELENQGIQAEIYEPQ